MSVVLLVMAPSYLEVGASGKPGAVHLLVETCVSSCVVSETKSILGYKSFLKLNCQRCQQGCLQPRMQPRALNA